MTGFQPRVRFIPCTTDSGRAVPRAVNPILNLLLGSRSRMSPFTYSVVKFQQDFHAWRPHRQFGMRRSNKSYRLTSESCAHSRDFWRLYPVEEVPHPYPQGVFQRLVSHQHDRCQPTPDHWEKRFGSCSWRRRWPSSAGFSADFFGMSYCSPPS